MRTRVIYVAAAAAANCATATGGAVPAAADAVAVLLLLIFMCNSMWISLPLRPRILPRVREGVHADILDLL